MSTVESHGNAANSYNDELVDFTGGHIALVAQLNVEIPELNVSNDFLQGEESRKTSLS